MKNKHNDDNLHLEGKYPLKFLSNVEIYFLEQNKYYIPATGTLLNIQNPQASSASAWCPGGLIIATPFVEKKNNREIGYL